MKRTGVLPVCFYFSSNIHALEIHTVTGFIDHFSFFVFLSTNTQAPALLTLLLILLLLVTFTISGAEVALFSLSSKDVNILKTKQHPAARRIISLLEEPKEVYASLLIASTFANICIIILSNFLINQFISFNEINFIIEILAKVLLIAFILVFLEKCYPKYGLRKIISGLLTVHHS